MSAVPFKKVELKEEIGQVEILSVLGKNEDGSDNNGVLYFDGGSGEDDPYVLRSKLGARLEVKATNNGPAGTWTMPFQCPTHTVNVTVTKEEDDDFMTIYITPDISGDWELTEDLINRDLKGQVMFGFVGLKMHVTI